MVSRKEKIVGFLFLFFIGMIPSSILAQMREGDNILKHDKKIDFGLKAGFASYTYIVSSLKINNQVINDLQNNYKLGYYASMFTRLNFKRNFLQVEATVNLNRAEVVFNKSTSSSDMASVTGSLYTIGFPVMYGYHIVKTGPYKMSLFGGPKLEYIWRSKTDYGNFDQQNIRESIYPFNFCLLGGVSINIDKVFFDFRYEQEVLNISKSITCDSNTALNETDNIIFHRRGGCLSFSFGVLF